MSPRSTKSGSRRKGTVESGLGEVYGAFANVMLVRCVTSSRNSSLTFASHRVAKVYISSDTCKSLGAVPSGGAANILVVGLRSAGHGTSRH